MLKRGGSVPLIIFLSIIAITFLFIGLWQAGIFYIPSSQYKAPSQNNALDQPKANIPNQPLANPTPTRKCRTVQVPYDDLEEYYETVPYTDRECEAKNLVYKLERGSCMDRQDNWIEDEPAKYSCTITNLDEQPASFSVNVGFSVQGQELGETQNSYIYPQSSHTFNVQRDANIDSCFCREVNLPTKQVCRDVTKYRKELRTRRITSYRSEQQCD